MISPKKLIAIARKWQKIAGTKRRVIALPKISKLWFANKGHFVVYSKDNKRFVVPLVCLGSNIFRELFRVAEEEYGLPSDGPITLPCDAACLEYVISVVQRQISKELEKALIASLGFSSQCSLIASVSEGLLCHPVVIISVSQS